MNFSHATFRRRRFVRGKQKRIRYGGVRAAVNIDREGCEQMDFPHGRYRKRKFGHGKKKRVRHGDARAAVLVLLDEQPMHGYQIIQEIEERTSGFWKPSPGSVYPVLQQLEDEGLVLIEQTDGRRVVNLTEVGRSYVEDNRTKLEGVWNAVINPVDKTMIDARNLFSLSKQIFIATQQVAQVGTDRQFTEAKKVLTDTRRRLYLILAEDEAGGEQDTGGATRA
jgi:DNA-binding PadR family transcriptional regulator